jgi:hypothetical protein
MTDVVVLPYKPSWVDRLIDSIDRQRLPTWLIYLIIAIPWVVVFIAVQAQQGAYEADGFYAWHLFITIQPLYGVAAIHFTDRVAANALRRFRPVMKGGETEYQAALYRLTTLPARPVLIAGLLGAVSTVVQLSFSTTEASAALQHVATTPISITLHNINIIVAWIGYGTVIYHSYHQLRVIDWLYTSGAVIDPLYPEPLYALSEITSWTAVLILINLYGWSAVIAGENLGTSPSEPLFYLTMMSWIMLGVLVFILPLWGAHRQLDETKDRALEGNARSYKTAIDELHHAVSTKTLDKIDAWQTALSALDLERRHLDRLAT